MTAGPSSSSSGSKHEQALDKAELKADKRVAKELDVSAKDVDKAIQETGQGRQPTRLIPTSTVAPDHPI
jgi:hypothetical protein